MKYIWILSGVIITTILSFSGITGLISSVYDWEKLSVKKNTAGEIRNIVRSPTRSLEMFEIQAITLNPENNNNKYRIKAGYDELIIVKEGVLQFVINGKKQLLGEGSVVVASSGEEVLISNTQSVKGVYYFIGFRPYQNGSQDTTEKTFSPVFIDWNKVEFIPSANGGRRNIMQQKTSVLKELEIHVTTLKEGMPSHSAHVHPDEEIILVRKGYVEETIRGEPYRLGPGSVIFLTNDDPHGISNAGRGECEYYAIRWLTYIP